MIRFLPVGETPVGVSGPAEDDAWVLQAAVGLQEARAERSAARDVLARTAPPWYHLRSVRAHRRADTAAARTFVRAHAEIQQHERSLAYHGAGTDPDEWGVFSLAPGISLEHTLRRPSMGRPEHPPSAAAGALLVQLPSARAAAVLGNVLPRIEIGRAVSALAAQAPVETLRDLVDHLPARARPLPRRVEDLDHHGTYTFSVTESESKIRLHDIVMGPVRGRGFGTSLLQELCRYADHRSLPIVCTMVIDRPFLAPGTSPEEYDAERSSAEHRLAAWYHRHGFRAGKPLDEWKSFTRLRREPLDHQ